MKYVFSTTLALALLTSAPALAQGKIDVMTQNQYLGADLTPIIEAGDEAEFNAAVVAALKEVAANDFPTRATLLAKLIANRLPDLVGLQEVFTFTCDDPPFDPPYDFLSDFLPDTPPDKGCDDPDIRNAFNDHLALTVAALVALDEPYEPVASVRNFDTRTVTLPPPPLPSQTPFPAGIPFVINGWLAVANMVDHDVILAPKDIADSVDPVPYSSLGCARPSADDGPGCNYSFVADVQLPGSQVLKIERGWVGVDARIDDKDYRFVDTHLEVQNPSDDPASPAVQAAQAQELIAVLAATTPPTRSLIVVGDINSSSEDPIIDLGTFQIVPPYTQFVGSGYTDAWTVTGDIPGFSCCEKSDLSNISSIHDERIDVIFSLDQEDWLNKAKKKRVLGSKVPDKSAPHGLWPSDHGSVGAELQFE
jgi:endonuclease/exonuclease/phosphatase family metal-dependent hydrolase